MRNSSVFLLRFALFPLGFLASACAAQTIPGKADTTTQTRRSDRQVVGVKGTHLTLDGSDWLPQGVMIRGFVSTPAFLSNPANGETSTAPATAAYGSRAQVHALRKYGADTLRFPVSQYYLAANQNPPSAPTAYAQSVVEAIATARRNGFVVVIQMQDEQPSGDPNWVDHKLPIADTASAWSFLNASFKKDRGVMYELYNEPNIAQTPADWALWLNGDPDGTSTVAPNAIGMQTMIDTLRNDGSENVFVLDGLELASTLEGLTPPSDRLNLLVYAVHPYQHGSADDSQWPAQFEQPSQIYPVFADEWGGLAGSSLMLGGLPNYRIAVKLLNHLRDYNIPLCTLAFDVPNFTTSGTVAVGDTPAYTPTNYDNYSPTRKGVDSGLLVKALFKSHYKHRVDLEDGVTH